VGAYLDQVCARLDSAVSAERRRELRTELAAHLEALIEAYAELGSPREEAISAAFQQFGPPARLGRQWSRAWRGSAGPVPSKAELTAALVVFAGLTAFFDAVLFSVLVDVFEFSLVQAALAGPIIPLIGGILWGRRFRERRSSYAPLALLVFQSMLISFLLPPSPAYAGHPLAVFHQAIAQVLMWIIVACGGAGATACIEMIREQRGEKIVSEK
jgi:hypothetical protein